jgi:hypothetical protein
VYQSKAAMKTIPRAEVVVRWLALAIFLATYGTR